MKFKELNDENNNNTNEELRIKYNWNNYKKQMFQGSVWHAHGED